MRARIGAVIVASTLALSGCATTIAGYQEQAYRNATSLKAESHALMATSATVPFPAAAAKVERLSIDIDAAYNYASGIPKNSISAKQWKLLRDGLFTPFMGTWRSQGRLSPAAATEDQGELDKAFDQIICLEANKRAATSCANTQGATP